MESYNELKRQTRFVYPIHSLQSAAAKTKHWDAMNTRMVNMGLSLYQQEITIRKSVDELLFSGYSDDMITTARTMTGLFGKKIEVPFDKFGWFYSVSRIRVGLSRIPSYFSGSCDFFGKM